MLNRRIEEPFASYTEALEHACKENIALWVNFDNVRSYLSKSQCTLLPIPKYEVKFFTSFITYGKWPYKMFLDHV